MSTTLSCSINVKSHYSSMGMSFHSAVLLPQLMSIQIANRLLNHLFYFQIFIWKVDVCLHFIPSHLVIKRM